MHFSTYLRIENKAGGYFASDRAFIRALRSKLKKSALKRSSREIRRELIADMFEFRKQSINQATKSY
mgnify:FL=1|jgi:putative ubiquitin-RnfH superfamily antitoxin RatB of RatAB toxin-antitoxin module|tara:strand:+ start:296 stop:496 length:201 start_codon:yes stop_codon:yes gene_type:complete